MTKVKDSAFTFKISFNASTELALVVFYEGADYHEIMQEKYSCLQSESFLLKLKVKSFKVVRILGKNFLEK